MIRRTTCSISIGIVSAFEISLSGGVYSLAANIESTLGAMGK